MGADAHDANQPPDTPAAAARLARALQHRRLPWILAALAVLLCSPTLFIGLHLDDDVHRYLLSDLPGSAGLREAYQSPFGIANGSVESNHWQIEQGYAPFWITPDLQVSLWRPISELTHHLDAALWPDSGFFMHLHSLVWFALLVAAAGWLYRAVAGGATVLAGLAALLFAIDHTHGFPVGWVANRNALVTVSLGIAALASHVEGRRRGELRWAALSVLLFIGALLSGEASVAVMTYLVGYALFADQATPARRLASVAPHAIVVVLWRIAYAAAGRGTHGSGMYIDPTAEPLEFLLAAVERLPILVLGELGLPPAEVHYLAGPGTAEALWVFAALVMVWWLVSIAPLLGRDPLARFWAFGGAASFVLVCSTHPHNRMLFYPSLGVLPLLATVWHGLVAGADWMPDATRWRKLATGLIAPVMAVHLVLSPLLLPLAACSIWFPAAPIERGLKQLADDAALSTRELVVVTAPEYFFVKLLPVVQRLQHAPVPARLRALSFGPVRTTVTRRDASTLDVHYAGGILQAPYTRLYRDPRIPMHVGETIALEGLRIEVTDVTPDGRLEGARFRFDGNLADGHRRFVYWDPDAGFVPFRLPAPGQSRTLPAAGLPLSI